MGLHGRATRRHGFDIEGGGEGDSGSEGWLPRFGVMEGTRLSEKGFIGIPTCRSAHRDIHRAIQCTEVALSHLKLEPVRLKTMHERALEPHQRALEPCNQG